MRIALFVTLSALLLIAPLRADVPKDAEIKKEVEKLQGKWTLASIEENGKLEPADEVAKYEVTIKDILFSVKIKDAEGRELTIKLDPSQKPATIDLMPKDGKGATVLASTSSMATHSLSVAPMRRRSGRRNLPPPRASR